MQRVVRSVCIVLLCAAFGRTAFAQTIPLSVKDAIGLALENNLDLNVDRFAPQTSLYEQLIAAGVFEPSIRIAGSFGRDTTPSRSQLTGAAALSQLTHSFSFGIGQSLPTGTSLGVDFVVNRTSSNSSFNTVNPAYIGSIQYSITQPLLKGFGVANNTRQIRVAQNNQKISETAFEKQLTDLLTQTENTYWDLVFAREDLNVKKRSLELAERTLKEDQAKVEIGTLAPIELVQAESEIALESDQVVLAEQNADRTTDQLKSGISGRRNPQMTSVNLNLTEPTDAALSYSIPDVETAIRVALENRPEMRQLQYELKNRDIDITAARNQLLPQLDLVGTYTQHGLNADASAALKQVVGINYTGYSAGFSLQIPLGNKAEKANAAQALLGKRESETKVAATSQQIALEVRNALTSVETNRTRIDTAQKSRELAEKQLAAEQAKFNLGSSTVRFVLDEQRNVVQAQTNHIQALVNYAKSIVELNRAMGATLQRFDIELEKQLSAQTAD